MPYAGKISLVVVAAGVTLGALLGDAANPVPKPPPEQWWQVASSSEFTAPSDEGRWGEIWPDDAGHPAHPDSYRPDLDYDAMITTYWEPPDDWDWYGDEEPAEFDSADTADQGVPHEVADQAVDEAVQAAEAAAAAAGAAPDPGPAEPPLARKALLTSEGIY